MPTPKAGIGAGRRLSKGTRANPLFFCTFAFYIGDAGSPAMEINGRRNKPFGPGGGTRRLHQSPPERACPTVGFGGGEIGSTRA